MILRLLVGPVSVAGLHASNCVGAWARIRGSIRSAQIALFGSAALIAGRGKWLIWDLADALTSHGNCVLVSVIRCVYYVQKVWFFFL